MGTITPRTRNDGSVAYKAQIRLRRGGVIVHSETQTFDRRPVAVAWMKKREKELALPGELERARLPKVTLDRAIGRYIEESTRAMGRTKNQVLSAIRRSDLASMNCDEIASPDIVAYLQTLDVKPQTVGNYASHLAAVFAIARPAWGYPLDQVAMKDAITVCKRLGITGKSRQRDRRPTLAELGALLDHFDDRKKRAPQAMPMSMVILFALFSTRRQEEIVSIRWGDLEADFSRVLVRDMKNPGDKDGNNVWVDLPDVARAVVRLAPRISDRIFPYSTGAISANFTRATKFLGIKDLHFHDLRHEGISRLFEIGWNIPHVASVSGHRSWNSLQRYTHIRISGDKYAGWKRLEALPHDPIADGRHDDAGQLDRLPGAASNHVRETALSPST